MKTPLLCVAVLTLLLALAKGDTRAAEEEVIRTMFSEDFAYNKHVRPPGIKNATIQVDGKTVTLPGEPVVVNVNMFVRHLGEIDDDTEDFLISLTMRQSWRDSRLSYTPTDSNLKYVLLNDPDQIWVPDLFFSNEKASFTHDLMTPNTMIRITPEGDILYSTRISVTLSCPMDFTNYPMDKQICSMRMASYAHTTKDLVFEWKEVDPVQSILNLDVSPFTLQGFGHDTCNSKTSTGEYSCLMAQFLFMRQLSTYLMNSYLPLALLVVVSWIIFWLDERATALRVIVAVITFIATVVEGSRVSGEAPHSGNIKAIDAWTNWTMIFVFMALLEQVAVILVTAREAPAATRHFDREIEEGGVAMTPLMDGNGEKETPVETSQQPQPNLVKKWLSKFSSTGRRIDIVSRVLFPVVFLIFNLTYWSSYQDYEGLRSLTVISKIPY